jgi:hypothetical protein
LCHSCGVAKRRSENPSRGPQDHREIHQPARRHRRHASTVTGGAAARLFCVCEAALPRESLDPRPPAKDDRELWPRMTGLCHSCGVAKRRSENPSRGPQDHREIHQPARRHRCHVSTVTGGAAACLFAYAKPRCRAIPLRAPRSLGFVGGGSLDPRPPAKDDRELWPRMTGLCHSCGVAKRRSENPSRGRRTTANALNTRGGIAATRAWFTCDGCRGSGCGGRRRPGRCP